MEKAKAHLPAGEADLSEALSKLATEKQLAEKARHEMERARDKVKKMEAELEIARRQIKDEAKRIKKEAQVEAEGLLKNTRRQMEHLIQGVGKKPGVSPPAVNKDRFRNAKQEVDRKLRNIAPRPERVILEIRELKAGESVHFKPGNSKVLVLSADDDKSEAVIQMENGLKLSCKYSDLGHVTQQLKPAPIPRPPATGVMSSKAMEEKGKLELDIRGKMVDQALPILDKFIDDALLTGLPFVRIIHGKGTGALKEAIHKHLPQAHPGVEFSLAEPAQGGSGATVIKFKPS
jgi:DNA mismatch repair protein MutS2